MERLLAHEGMVRNRRKIQGTIENGRIVQGPIAEHRSLHAHLRSPDGLSWKERRKTLSKKSKYLGPNGVYFFLRSVAEEVPPWQERDR